MSSGIPFGQAAGSVLFGDTFKIGSLFAVVPASGNLAINTDKFTVAGATGNTAIGGTLAVTGASTLTGNVACSGTLAVTGTSTLTSATNVVGAFTVNTNKFSVTAANGNTAIAGTCNVASTFTVATDKFAVSSAGKITTASLATLSFLTTAITANSTTTSEIAGSVAITTHATGVGKLFVSDGSKWQYMAVA